MTENATAAPGERGPGKAEEKMSAPFILYLSGEDLVAARRGLSVWVHQLLLPVYGEEESSRNPWCPRWWEHRDAVAHLYGLWMAWQELTDQGAGMTGPAVWHRDHLRPVMTHLRDPSGPFSGCKPTAHRPKHPPHVDQFRT